MTVNIIACGQSSERWYEKAPKGFNILINDAFKFGHKGDALLCYNHPNKFTKERLNIILSTRPIKLYTCYDAWWNYFDDMVLTKTRSYDGHLRKDCDRITTADTSPIIAMSLAHCLGASKIILWGADFVNHSTFNKTNPHTKTELRQYQGYTNLLRASGIEVYLGAKGSALESFLPVYEER